MTDLLRVRSGGRNLNDDHRADVPSAPTATTSSDRTVWPSVGPVRRRTGVASTIRPTDSDVDRPQRSSLTIPLERDDRPPIVDAAAVGLLCVLALYVATVHGWSVDDDGAGIVPIIALVSIATAAVRRRPGRNSAPVRVVSVRLALLVGAAGSALVAITVLDHEPPARTIGPMVSLAMIGAYLAIWGFRSLALLRTVTLLSFLTWAPVAEAVHAIVRSSLGQPSELIYQRLATLTVFGVEDEPWKLFTASLHRGSLVVITVVLLGIAASRWRITPRMLIDLAISAAVAVVVHHVIVLGSSVDQYDPTETTEVATNPVLEVAVALIAVLVLTAIRHRRHRGSEPVALPDAASGEAAARDPVIFATDRAVSGPIVTALLLLGLAPLITVAVLG